MNLKTIIYRITGYSKDDANRYVHDIVFVKNVSFDTYKDIDEAGMHKHIKEEASTAIWKGDAEFVVYRWWPDKDGLFERGGELSKGEMEAEKDALRPTWYLGG